MRTKSGYSITELTVVIGVMATTAAIASPRILTALDDFRTLGAVRYLSTSFQQARMEAIVRHADIGFAHAHGACAGADFKNFGRRRPGTTGPCEPRPEKTDRPR